MRTVTVTGQGEARIAPDCAVVRLAAVHRAPGVAEALSGADSAASQIATTARQFTTAERVGSTSLQIWTSHDEQGRPDGFQARHSLTVRCPDIAAAGSLLTAVAGSVGDRLEVEGVSLEVAD
ncbi:MAG: SIMPL domain-containing protein, partial [Nocardioides sp.]